MDPILPKLGNITIQRLAKPKDAKVGPQSSSGSLDQLAPEKVPPLADNASADLKRSFPEFGNLPPGVSLKKFKPTPDFAEKSQPPIVNKSVTIIDKNQSIEKTLESLQRKNSDLNDTSYSENEMTDYDSAEDSDIESDTDLTDLGSLGLKPLPTAPISEPKSSNKQVETPVKLTEPPNDLMASPSFLDKLVAEAEQAGSPTSTPPSDSPPLLESLDADSPPLEPKDEPQDDDYDIDIKEKLKEMGEITFGTVKKSESKPKKEDEEENEVSLTKKSGDKEEEVTLTTSKGNLRRNIREVMDETKLDEATLAAQREEAERLRRVQEQQRIIREYQRQAQQEKMQQRVLSLLQGTNFSKPGPSNQTRIGNTVLVKLPNGQTKPMTKLPKRPHDFMKVPRPDMGPFHPGMMGHRGPPFGHPRGFPAPPGRRPGMHLPPHMGPMPRRGHFNMPRHGSDSDSDGEERRMGLSRPRGKHSQPTQSIDISSDDDCIVVSDSEADQQQEDDDQQDDPSNSGMHTNDEFNQPDEQGRVLVNVGHAEDEPDVFVAPQIAKIIKPHQIGGVRFMYDNVVECINRFETSAGFGCILAHSMGLGKTLQIVTFSDIFLRFTPSKTIICIMPINTLQNWLSEYNMWLPTEDKAAESPLNANGEVRPRKFNIHVLNDAHKTLAARSNVVKAWKTDGGVLLIGYEQFRLLSTKKQPKKRAPKGGAAPPPQQENPEETDSTKQMFDEIYEALVNPGPDLVICDEGHRIKNQNASTSTALKQVRTKRRIVLTGYPLQNNLLEYWCMVDFVRPNYLGSKTEFLNMFERPIMNGQCIDSTEADIKLMRYRAHVLHSLLVGFVQRRSHAVLRTALPQKEEYVMLMRLTPFQRKLYDTFMNDVMRTQSSPNPLKAFAVCCKIWNHPDVLYNYLLKRSKGEAVDLDLEEVGSVTGETKSKKTSGRPKGRQASPRGKNAKPAASVTPYTSNSDHLMQPPASTSVPVNPQANNSNGMTAQTQNTSSNSSKTQGPFLSNEVINQPRTSFEGIGQLFEQSSSPNASQSQVTSQPQPSSVTQSHQFDFLSPNSSFAQHLQSQTSNSNSFSQNQNCLTPNANAILETNSQGSSSNQTFLNLDNQTTTTIKSSASSVKLPAGISLTPTSKKNTQSQNSSVPATAQSSSSHPALAGLPSGISLTPLSKNILSQNQTAQNSQNPTPFGPQPSQQDSGFSQNNQTEQQQNSGQYQHQENHGYNESGPQENYNNQPNYWEQSPNGYNNPPQNNAYTPPQSSWIKKEDPSPRSTPNPFVSPVKSETSNESKPKINIISDIKIPANKKISILSDFKPKKEELDDKINVKQELELLSREIKNDLKIEDGIPKLNESPLSKLAGVLPLKETKEDGIPYDWAVELLKDYVPGKLENSAKFQILFCIIKESLTLGDRLLVFSQSLMTLDLIEQFLQAREIPGETRKWAKNHSYYRLDGSTGAQEREKMINEFNSNPKLHLFLVSTRAGSLGINLIGANRVVVLDASWNPCHDTQAVCRVYRYGQRKPCFVYRLVIDQCMEKKIYDRQVSKQGMSDRVVDECNPDAYLMQKDVSSLCFDEKIEEGEIKDWSDIKDNYIDVVLQKVLENYGTMFNKEPFQHESLLVDRKEKQLSSQEKRLAKKGYEREKQAALRPSYLMGAGRGHRPVASVRPMQQGGERRPNRWIPAEHWQRQGMTAQEMTLPLDVVIPTNQPEKGNIVLKAGQKVLVLKSPKGVYMQLESGKIVAIKTAIKVKGKAEDNTDPLKLFSQHQQHQMSNLTQPLLPPQMKNNHPSLSVNPQKRPPFLPNNPSLKVRSVKNVPNITPKPNLIRRGPQMARPNPYQAGSNSHSMEPTPGSSSEDEQNPHFPIIPGLTSPERPGVPRPTESADEIQKILLKKNISIQRVTNQQPKQQKSTNEAGALARMTKVSAARSNVKIGNSVSNIDKLEQSTNSILDGLPFQDTLESITANFKNPEGLDQSDSDENEHEAEEDVLEEENEELGLEEQEPEEEPLSDSELMDQSKTTEEDGNQSDEVSYVSEQPADPNQQQYQADGAGKEGSTEYGGQPAGYNQNQGYYGYNAPPYQPPPHPQGYGYPPQQPPNYDMAYQGHPPPYNYGYQGYPQPHYPPPPQPAGYDYSNPAAPPAGQPMAYPGYTPYPQQYPPPPQGMYPPTPAQGQTPAPPASGYDYQQYPNQTQPNTGGYYPNT